MKAARHLGRHGERDAAMVLLMFRHGPGHRRACVAQVEPGGSQAGLPGCEACQGREQLEAPPARSATSSPAGSYCGIIRNRPMYSCRSGAHRSRRDLFGTSSLPPGEGAGLRFRGSSPSAEACLRLFSRLKGARHAGNSGLSGSQGHSPQGWIPRKWPRGPLESLLR